MNFCLLMSPYPFPTSVYIFSKKKKNPLLIFLIFNLAEGTTTNGDYLLPFRTGAFLARVPVQPVILRYPYTMFSPAWDSMDGVSFSYIFVFVSK